MIKVYEVKDSTGEDVSFLDIISRMNSFHSQNKQPDIPRYNLDDTSVFIRYRGTKNKGSTARIEMSQENPKLKSTLENQLKASLVEISPWE